ncbi:hypothetical protein GCM10007415_11630 [Parapedobacter pyrenivorans]|uniref:Uncharacterized protein n=1 Tax=Parapedobacter pyrenivorans TaxID=1305674 RepID=A0A917HJB4_9SPHI|nr:hypothetical protein [Parapedobacter pyrenivorans]GGG80793.1 hypothetical protein GCM10007415_11630 [Parapedobacter pyrenivorans]
MPFRKSALDVLDYGRSVNQIIYLFEYPFRIPDFVDIEMQARYRTVREIKQIRGIFTMQRLPAGNTWPPSAEAFPIGEFRVLVVFFEAVLLT